MRKLTTKEFIQKAKLKHGNKYDYSLVDYINNKIKIKIICPKHGIFEQTPNNHLNGTLCYKCVNIVKTTKEFIQKAKLKHDNKYDYSLVKYKDSKTKVKIICLEHGTFEQTPNNHLNGKNCLICAGHEKLTTKEFIQKAKLKHGNKYDYSLVDYINSQTKVEIICLEHGIFKQLPNSHLNGIGCPTCGGTKKLTTKEFIQKAKLKHDNKYDYSLVDYINSQTKVKIICLEHGIFEQTPNSHLNGVGCPICKSSKGEQQIINYLKRNNIKYIKEYKFNNCKNMRPLPFDFYLPDKNILIEYDGIQHFKPFTFFGGVNGLNYRIRNDNIKTEYCKNYNIKLIRIKYNDVVNKKLKIDIF